MPPPSIFGVAVAPARWLLVFKTTSTFSATDSPPQALAPRGALVAWVADARNSYPAACPDAEGGTKIYFPRCWEAARVTLALKGNARFGLTLFLHSGSRAPTQRSRVLDFGDERSVCCVIPEIHSGDYLTFEITNRDALVHADTFLYLEALRSVA